MNNFSRLLKQAKRSGVHDGFQSCALLMLIALYNVADDYVAEDKQAALAKAIEQEGNRIFLEECKADLDVIGDRLLGHVDRIRQRWGMDPLEVGDEQ